MKEKWEESAKKITQRCMKRRNRSTRLSKRILDAISPLETYKRKGSHEVQGCRGKKKREHNTNGEGFLKGGKGAP